MKDAILKTLKKLGDGVSFVDLSKIDGFAGGLSYGFPEKNIYFWFSCSQDAIDALNELMEEKKIDWQDTHPLTYYVDGVIPPAPVFKSYRAYKKPRWAPVVFCKG